MVPAAVPVSVRGGRKPLEIALSPAMGIGRLATFPARWRVEGAERVFGIAARQTGPFYGHPARLDE